jgi:C4-dicarboxylate transporter, DctM subunit
MAGVFPGLLMTGVFMAYIAILLLFNPKLAPPRKGGDQGGPPFSDILHVLPVLSLLFVVLGGIYLGLTTPTEAAAVGAAGAIVLAAGYGGLSRKVFSEALMSTVKTTCMVTLIIIGAQILSSALTYSGVSRAVSEWILGLGLSRWVFLAAVVGLYIILGCFVDGISMIYMTLPVLLPVIKAFDFDLIWFGIILTIAIELGQITPPVGLNLFTIHAISGGHSFSDVVKGSFPYVFLMLFVMVLLCFFPQIALWLPTTVRG